MKVIPLFLAVSLLAGCQSMIAPTNDEEAMVYSFATASALIRWSDVKHQRCREKSTTAYGRRDCATTYRDELSDINEAADAVKRYKTGFFSGMFDGVSTGEYELARKRLSALTTLLKRPIGVIDYEVI